MHKRILVAMMVGVVALAAVAQQNARIESMGGSLIVGDITDVLRMPGYMNDYKNNLQVTFNSPIIGIKSFGSVVSVGGIFNQNLMLNSGFYFDGITFVNNMGLPGELDITPAATIQRAPHLLFGLDFSVVKLTFDGFWEHSNVTYHYEETVVAPPAATTLNTIDVTKSVSNPGFQIGVNFGSTEVPVAIVGGLGFPSISAERIEKMTALVDVKTTLSSEKGLFAKVGGEVGFPVMQMQLKAGAIWTMEQYQFKDETGINPIVTLTDAENVLNTISPYVGFKAPISNGILLVMQENTDIAFLNTKSETVAGTIQTNVDDNTTYLMLNLSLGAEKAFAGILRLDSLSLRGGVSYPVTSTFTNNETVVTNSVGPTTTTTIDESGDVVTWGNATPYLGLGANIGAFSLDVSLNPANWAGVMNGPDVATCTATLKF